MARLKTISANLNALLETIAYAEGTSTSPITKDEGYDVIVSGVDGPEIMTSYVDHPFANGRKSKVINSKGLTSNAAGKYQQMLKDWAHYKKLLGLFDFGPIAQDRLAIQHIRECRALVLIENGDFEGTIERIRNIWASLPGAGYGQREHNFNDLLAVYLSKGGKLWASKQSSASLVQPLPVSLEPSLSDAPKVNPKPIQTTESDNPKSTLNGLFNLIKKLLTRK